MAMAIPEACFRASGLFMAFLASCSIDANHAVVLAVPSCRLFGWRFRAEAKLEDSGSPAGAGWLVWMVESCLATKW